MDGDGSFTVRELNRLIQHALSLTFPDELWVEGEISSLKRHQASGHVYFDLVDVRDGERDPQATIPVTLFRTNKEAVNAQLRRADAAHPGASVRMGDGIQVRIRGAIVYHPPTGRVQLRMTAIDPAHTLGRLAAARDQLLAALVRDGLLERNRLQPWPPLPLRVGLITSDRSAAHADFMHELTASGIGWNIVLAASAVQGPGADRAVAGAIGRLVDHGVDVIAIVRGGGARTDLLAFDSEPVARAIANCPVPVLTGIGHEIDVSIADLVAARSHKTPTACAASLVAHVQATTAQAELTWASILTAAHTRLDQRERDLVATGRRMALTGRAQLHRGAQRVDHDVDRLRRSTAAAATGADRRLASMAVRVDAVDPRRVLARGWSITRGADGRVIRDLDAIRDGDTLTTTLATGTLHSVVADPGNDHGA